MYYKKAYVRTNRITTSKICLITKTQVPGKWTLKGTHHVLRCLTHNVDGPEYGKRERSKALAAMAHPELFCQECAKIAAAEQSYLYEETKTLEDKMIMIYVKDIQNIEQLKNLSLGIGHYFFEPAKMKADQCRLYPDLVYIQSDGMAFIMSMAPAYAPPGRQYKIYVMRHTGKIELADNTVYRSLAAARDALGDLVVRRNRAMEARLNGR